MKNLFSFLSVASVVLKTQRLLSSSKQIIPEFVSSSEAEEPQLEVTEATETVATIATSKSDPETDQLNVAARLASTKKQVVTQDSDASADTRETNMRPDQVPLSETQGHAESNTSDSRAEELARTRVKGSLYNAESDNLSYAVAKAKVEQHHIANSNSKQNVKLRRDMAVWAMAIVSLQLFFVNVGFLDMTGFQLRELHVALDNQLVIAWLTTTLVQVIGIIMVVANYLYKAENLSSVDSQNAESGP